MHDPNFDPSAQYKVDTQKKRLNFGKSEKPDLDYESQNIDFDPSMQY